MWRFQKPESLKVKPGDLNILGFADEDKPRAFNIEIGGLPIGGNPRAEFSPERAGRCRRAFLRQ